MSRLVLIDANALIHRSFHALPALQTKNGQPIQAVYGFLSLFLKMYKELKPDYLAVAFDRPELTFRHKEFAEYKAQRPKTPEDLVSQIAIVKELIKAFGLKVFEKPGYEADDIIGSFVEKYKGDKNLEKIVIVTGDLDILQLVSGKKVVVWTLKTGISQTIIYDQEKVKQRFDLLPKQLIDFKALKGDPSDNIPGLPSIGQKTAQKLISKFGSLENLYKTLEKNPEKFSDFPQRIVNILKENKELAFFSKELVSLRLDIELKTDLNDLKISPKKQEIKKLFDKYEFFSLWPRFLEAFGFEEKKLLFKQPLKNIQTIEPEKIEEKINFKKEVFLLEKKGLLPADSKIIIADDKNIFETKQSKKLIDFIFSQKATVVGYGLKEILKTLNIKPKAKIIDLKIASWLLSPQKANFSLQKDYFNFFKKEPFSEIEALKELYPKIISEIKKERLEKVFNEIEMPLVNILAKMEKQGIGLDKEVFDNLKKEIKKALKKLGQDIYKIAGKEFNINSSRQVSEILFETLKLPKDLLAKTPKGAISTRSEELLKIKDKNPIIEKIISYKELSKLLNTYIEPLPLMADKNSRLHPNFVQTGTATGRLACQDPNLQNIPAGNDLAKKLRQGFISKKGFYFVSFDYSQIELRVAALLCGDKNLKEAFLQGKDIHQETAKIIFGLKKEVQPWQRRIAKILNFGLLYGMGKKALSQTAGISLEEASEFIKKYFEKFPLFKEYQQEILKKAEKQGFLETFFGRKRYFENIKSFNHKFKAQAQRAAINFPIQGTAADIIKIAMGRIDNLIKNKDWQDKAFLILQIHDELIFEIDKDIIDVATKEIKQTMEGINLKVPLKVNIKTGKTLAF